MSHNNGPMGHWVNVAKNTSTCGVPPKKKHQKRKLFFSISTTRLAESVEGLNSYLAQLPGEL